MNEKSTDISTDMAVCVCACVCVCVCVCARARACVCVNHIYDIQFDTVNAHCTGDIRARTNVYSRSL